VSVLIAHTSPVIRTRVVSFRGSTSVRHSSLKDVAYVLAKKLLVCQCGGGRKDALVGMLCIDAGRGNSLKYKSTG